MKYATIKQYADLSGVSHQAIYDRIKSGSITTVEKEDFTGEVKTVIDLKKYPPSKGRKVKAS
jgi:predicted DNA-binding protein YlxM (UPF0122 family)